MSPKIPIRSVKRDLKGRIVVVWPSGHTTGPWSEDDLVKECDEDDWIEISRMLREYDEDPKKQPVLDDDALIEKARALATRVHTGQTDKGHHPYIEHPLRVAEFVAGEGRDAVIAALLHDVIEDGGISAAELLADGFPEAAVRAVEIVTKREGEHGTEEGYRNFIERIATSGSECAIRVKLADLADNSDLTRLGRPPSEKDRARARKYEASRDRLSRTLPTRVVFCQQWDEYERGWGPRPDGFTLHLTEEDRDRYVEGYNGQFNNKPVAPDQYTVPDGPVRPVKVSEEVYEQIVAQKTSLNVKGDWQRLGWWGQGNRAPKS